jgi:hypothetical protein
VPLAYSTINDIHGAWRVSFLHLILHFDLKFLTGDDGERRSWPAANAANVNYHRMPSLCGYFQDISDGNGPMSSFADDRIWR